MELISNAVLYFHKGGFVMYLLLLCSLFVVSIAIERSMYFSKMDAGRKFARGFYEHLTQQHYAEAAEDVKNANGILPEILRGAMRLAGTNYHAMTSYMEVQSGIALSQFRRRLYYLNVIVTMAPLLGLLGTISGMISSFSVFDIDGGKATAITGGVSEALIATAFGLCVAILALTVHSYFTQRIENIVTDMEQCFSLVEGEREHIAKAGVE
nr:MotA/TolQ/ExbB proton channel family protein [Schwartzia sp. (in: firmicutes)]